MENEDKQATPGRRRMPTRWATALTVAWLAGIVGLLAWWLSMRALRTGDLYYFTPSAAAKLGLFHLLNPYASSVVIAGLVGIGTNRLGGSTFPFLRALPYAAAALAAIGLLGEIAMSRQVPGGLIGSGNMTIAVGASLAGIVAGHYLMLRWLAGGKSAD